MTDTGINISSNALPTARGNRVRIVIYSATPTARTLFARVKQADKQGNIIFSTQQIPMTAGGGIFVGIIILTDGYLLEVNVWDPNSYQPFGRTFGYVYFQGGDVFGQETAFPLVTGFIGGGRPLIWPLMPSESNNDIALEPDLETPANPAAGTALQYSGGTNEVIRIIGGSITLATDATVANRTIFLSQETAGVEFAVAFSRTTIPASTTRTIEFWRGPNLPTDSADRFYLAIPDTALLIEGTFTFNALQLQAADQFSAAVLILERHVVVEA